MTQPDMQIGRRGEELSICECPGRFCLFLSNKFNISTPKTAGP